MVKDFENCYSFLHNNNCKFGILAYEHDDLLINNTSYKKYVNDLIMARGDVLTSERECASAYLNYVLNGYINIYGGYSVEVYTPDD